MKRTIKTAASAAMYNPVSQATVAANGMLYTAAGRRFEAFAAYRSSPTLDNGTSA